MVFCQKNLVVHNVQVDGYSWNVWTCFVFAQSAGALEYTNWISAEK